MLGSANSLLTSRLLNDFRSSARASTQHLQRAPVDPAAEVYRLLDNYAADISKAEEEIKSLTRQREEVEEKQEVVRRELQATRELAATAAGEVVTMTAELHHVEAELTAKKLQAEELKQKLAEVQCKSEERRQKMNMEKEDFLVHSEQVMAKYRATIRGRPGSWLEDEA